MAVSKTEIDAFNRDFDMYEQWKREVLDEKLMKIKSYDFNSMAPNEPQWHKNLQKAHRVKQEQKMIKDAIRDMGKVQAPSLEEVRTNPHAWQKYCEEREVKRPVGRPRLPESMKKQNNTMKRSDKMRAMLADHGITVNKSNTLEPASAYKGWIFLPNGRVRFEDESSISVHSFLRDYC